MDILTALQAGISFSNTFIFAPLVALMAYRVTRNRKRSIIGARLLIVAAATYMILNVHWFSCMADAKNIDIEAAWSMNELMWLVGSLMLFMSMRSGRTGDDKEVPRVVPQ